MRFKFGKNWSEYSSKITHTNIQFAVNELLYFIKEPVSDKNFLDIGSGSGIHSLAAQRIGFRKIYSFDFDEDSVRTTEKIKEDYGDKLNWQTEQGDVLDKEYILKIGKFDVVYSWGVLHHTGHMWQAIENAMLCVENKGLFIIAIYNDQGWKSKFWWFVKRGYNILPDILKKPFAYVLGYLFTGINILKYTILLKPRQAIDPLLNYGKNRGMKFNNDLIDWIGGYPYEYASVDSLDKFFSNKGFNKVCEKRTTSLGCNQIMYKRI